VYPDTGLPTVKKRTVAVGLLGAVAVAAWLGWAFAPRPVDVETAQAARGHFELAIEEDGKTRLRDRYVVSAPLAGRLSRITLHEGDRVRVGTELATLAPVFSPMLDERSLREQRARVEAAEANVARADARIARAQIATEQARNEAVRTEQLAQRGFVAATKLEADRLNVQAAQKERDAAVQERHIAEHDLEQARAALVAVRQGGTAGRTFAVRAPIDGTVLKVVQASETVVPLGAPLVELGDTMALEVVAEVLTTEALRTRPGDPVQIGRWGGPGVLDGRVRLVEPAAFTKVSALGVEEQRVRVLIDLTSPPERWRALGDGFRVGLRIVVQSEDDALRVPVSAVFPLPGAADQVDSAKMAAFVVDAGRARQVEVEVGGRDGRHAWVRRGLQPGDTVIVYPPPNVRDGVRVRPRTV
jgi:HlyD family secretion protein